MSARVVFLTGGTGFLGRWLVPKLARTFDEVVLLVRPDSLPKARKLYADLPKVRLVAGDLSLPSLVLQDEDRILLESTVTDFVHLGALYDLRANLADSYSANVVGTQNVMDFCGRLRALKHIHHASTIAIAGDFRGIFQERMFNVGQGFPNAYAQTKYRAEGLIGSWKTKIPRYIYRLGILVGDSRTGEIPKIDGPYYLIEALAKHRRLFKAMTVAGRVPLPVNPQTEIYLLPVDAAASALAVMIEDPVELTESYRTYHLVGNPVGVMTFLDDVLERMDFDAHAVALPSVLLPSIVIEKLGIPPETVFYMNSRFLFDDRQLRADFPMIQTPSYRDFAEVMIRAALARIRGDR